MKPCNESRTHSEVIQRLIDFVGPDANMVAGIAAPRGLPYSFFQTDDVIPGTQGLWLNWDDSENRTASMIVQGQPNRDATASELREILAFYENRLLGRLEYQPFQRHFLSSLGAESLSFNLCREILLPELVG